MWTKGVSLKKSIFIILGFLCVITASAVSYASPYKGAGNGGYVYASSSSRLSTYGGSGMAQAPTASMGSVNRGGGFSYSGGTMAMSMPSVVSVRTITTSATRVTGGVTTYTATSPRRGAARKSPGNNGDPGAGPDGCECHWEWDDVNNKWVCTICECEITLDDYLDYGLDACDCDPCRCPIDFDWMAGLFMALLAAAYAFYKSRRKKSLSMFIAFK